MIISGVGNREEEIYSKICEWQNLTSTETKISIFLVCIDFVYFALLLPYSYSPLSLLVLQLLTFIPLSLSRHPRLDSGRVDG